MSDATDLERLRLILRGLAHELASPMTPLLGHIELLEARLDLPDSPGVAKHFLAMRRSVQRLVALNDGLIDFARSERGYYSSEPRRIRLGGFARDVVDELSGDEEGALAVTVMEDADPHAEVTCDPSLLRRFLRLVLDNVRDHAGPDAEAVIRHGLGDGGGWWLEVRDSGIGVASGHLAQLADPFFCVSRTGRTPQSAGLGLATAAIIAERLGGELTISATDPDDEERPGITARLSVRTAR